MANKKKIFLSIVVLLILIYLFNIRKIELFNFKDEQITRSNITHTSEGSSPKTYSLDNKTINTFLNRIKEEDFRSSFQIRNKNEALTVKSDKSITIRIYTSAGNSKDYYYIFEIFENGVISYKKYKGESDTILVDKIIKTGIWNNQKAKNLYSDLEEMVLKDYIQ